MNRMSKLTNFALMAIAMISSVTYLGAEEGAFVEKKGVRTRVKEKGMRQKEKVMQQFEESLDRLKRCFKGECTKREALKAARDLGIAAVGVVTALYVTGSALQKGSGFAIRMTPEQYQGGVKIATWPLRKAGYYMKKPGRPVIGEVGSLATKGRRLFYPFLPGDQVRYRDKYGDRLFRVEAYNPTTRKVTIEVNGVKEEVSALKIEFYSYDQKTVAF